MSSSTWLGVVTRILAIACVRACVGGWVGGWVAAMRTNVRA